jgi:hypothetical protein
VLTQLGERRDAPVCKRHSLAIAENVPVEVVPFPVVVDLGEDVEGDLHQPHRPALCPEQVGRDAVDVSTAHLAEFEEDERVVDGTTVGVSRLDQVVERRLV